MGSACHSYICARFRIMKPHLEGLGSVLGEARECALDALNKHPPSSDGLTLQAAEGGSWSACTATGSTASLRVRCYLTPSPPRLGGPARLASLEACLAGPEAWRFLGLLDGLLSELESCIRRRGYLLALEEQEEFLEGPPGLG